MRLNEITLTNFKRFKKLHISKIPSTAKLVILTGPNGSGKTSLFEAFNYWMNCVRQSNNFDMEYHVRASMGTNHTWHTLLQQIALQFHGHSGPAMPDQQFHKKTFYIRSAYRHEPDFTSNGLSKTDEILNDSHRAMRLINQESRVSENYQRMVGDSILALYDPLNHNVTAGDITNKLMGEVRLAMTEVFGDLILQGPGNPLTGGTFRFKKGTSDGFHYKNLSGGEKAAFDLLLDFLVKRSAFDDTIFCIDEPELHMHTKLQSNLLNHLFSLIPENSQLWIATHSIGMSRRAAELFRENPGQVAFIDFHDIDFDQEIELLPVLPSKSFWQNMFSTALDDLSQLVIPKAVVFCEGKRLGSTTRKPSFDVEVYRRIFIPQMAEIDFIPLGGTSEVLNDGSAISLILNRLAPGVKTWKVFDRDDRHDSEIIELKRTGIRVLDRRDLESYLWDDEIIELLCNNCGHLEKYTHIKEEKQNFLQQSHTDRGNPIDDIKSIAGQLYNLCKQELALTQCGNDAEAFARLTLAPLIVPGTKTYESLASVVIAPLA